MRIGTRITQAARRTLLGVLGFVLAPGSASAQTPDLVTDRPDQTESATVVPRGLVQVETGYLFARDDGVDTFEVPGTLFRIGLGARSELRVGHAGVIGSEGRHGAGDSEIGAKVNLIETADGWTPELAILGGLSLPTGEEAFSSDGVDPSFLVAFAHGLSPRRSLGYNVGGAWESSPDQPDREASLLYSLALGMGVTNRLGAFIEVFGDRRTTGDTATGVSIDGGLTFLLTDAMQIDSFCRTSTPVQKFDDVFSCGVVRWGRRGPGRAGHEAGEVLLGEFPSVPRRGVWQGHDTLAGDTVVSRNQGPRVSPEVNS